MVAGAAAAAAGKVQTIIDRSSRQLNQPAGKEDQCNDQNLKINGKSFQSLKRSWQSEQELVATKSATSNVVTVSLVMKNS